MPKQEKIESLDLSGEESAEVKRITIKLSNNKN